jgi:hypothetical protein
MSKAKGKRPAGRHIGSGVSCGTGSEHQGSRTLESAQTCSFNQYYTSPSPGYGGVSALNIHSPSTLDPLPLVHTGVTFFIIRMRVHSVHQVSEWVTELDACIQNDSMFTSSWRLSAPCLLFSSQGFWNGMALNMQLEDAEHRKAPSKCVDPHGSEIICNLMLQYFRYYSFMLAVVELNWV